MANNTPKNSQETKEQNQRTVSEKLQLAVAATLALMMADLSSSTQLQQQYADRGAEISQSMKEIGSKAVDKMLVGLEKVVDAIGPTPAYAGGNPDEERRRKAVDKEIDDIFGDTKGDIKKADERNQKLNKEVKQIQEKRMHIDKVEPALKFADDIVHSKVPLNSSTKIKWQQSKKDIENHMFVYEQDMQMKFKEMIKIVDEILKYAK